MDLQTILIGAAAALIGLAFCFAGYPLFLILLPIWAFLHGFLGGASGTAQALGGGFLGDAVGLGVGLFLGVLFAILAYAFWWAGVILLGATLGYVLGSGALTAIGVNPGLLTFITGMALAAVFGVLFVMYRMPRVLVAILTAAGGAVTAVGGALVLFGIVKIDTFKAGPLAAITNQGIISALLAIVLTVAGILIQLQLSKNTEVTIWRRTMGDEA